MSARNHLANKKIRREEREAKRALQKKAALQSKMMELSQRELEVTSEEFKPCLPIQCNAGITEE